MSTVLISGNAGLLGSHVADKFLREGWNVVGIDNLIGGFKRNIHTDVNFYQEDCLNFEAVGKIMKKHRPEVVIHAACTAYEGLSVFSPSLIFDNTASASVAMASAAAASGIRRFVFCSSMARYGDSGGIQFTEDMIPRPQDPYGIAKIAAENVISLLSVVHNFEFVTLVPHNIIGPRQKFDDPYRNVAAIMINRMLRGLPPIIYGDGEQIRSFSFVNDVVDPIYRAATVPGLNTEIINIGPDDNEISINDLVKLLAQILGFKEKPIYVPSRPQEVKFATCSADKARRLLGFQSTVDLQSGLDLMIQYIRSVGPREFSYNLRLEIENELTPTTWKNHLI